MVNSSAVVMAKNRLKARFRFPVVSAKKYCFGNSFGFGQELAESSAAPKLSQHCAYTISLRSGKFATRMLIAISPHTALIDFSFCCFHPYII